MNYLKAYIAGLAFPATLLPLIYLAFYASGHEAIHSQPLQFMPLFIPIIFGIWNMGAFACGDRCPIKDRNLKLWVTGMSLGFLVALVGVFCIELPRLLLGLEGLMFYAPLVIVPIVYGLIWRYIVDYLNRLVGVA